MLFDVVHSACSLGSAALGALLALAALGCGGKLAPFDAGEAVDAGAEAPSGDDAGPIPVVDSVTPASGPNSGGTTVTITGSGFVGDGGTSIAFAGFPATGVACPTPHRCVAVSPFAGYQGFDQVVHVQATLGPADNPPAKWSVTRRQDRFTFTSGPPCTSALVCNGIFYPQLSLTCPMAVNLYEYPGYKDQKLVASGLAFTVDTQSQGAQAVATCYGDPASSSCTSFTTFTELRNFCGAGLFCAACKKIGGICTMDSYGNATCTKNPYPPSSGSGM